jgi:hypothetical protein
MALICPKTTKTKSAGQMVDFRQYSMSDEHMGGGQYQAVTRLLAPTPSIAFSYNTLTR